MDTTGARAGVLALLLHTGKMVGTFSVDQTFWSAIGRHANVTNFASTPSNVAILNSTVGIRSTRGR